MGAVLGLKAFAVAIIGGLTSGMGIIVGGIILGIAETTTGFYLSTGYKDVPGLVLLLIVLAVQARRPVRQDRDQEGLTMKRQSPSSSRSSASPRSLLFPLGVSNPYYIHLLETIMIYAIVLFGLDIVVGYTGQVSLGHAGLFGIGAYAAGVLVLKLGAPLLVTLPAAIGVTARASARCWRCRRCASRGRTSRW